MALHALVKDGEILEYRDFEPNVDQSQLAQGKPRWLPVEDDEVDPVSQVRDVAVIEEGRVYRPSRTKSAEEVAQMRVEKDAAIEDEFERRWQAPILFEVGGIEYEFHADQESINNIQGVLDVYKELERMGQPIPVSRNWTPKDSFTPITITRDELALLGIAIAVRKDALFAKKKQKQFALSQLTEPVDVANYDVTDWA